MKKGCKVTLYIVIAIAVLGIIFAIVYHNVIKNKGNEVAWIKSGNHQVGKELSAGEYVLIATGKKPNYEIIKDKIEVAKDSIDNQAYITIEKGQTVKLVDAKMCKINEAPIFKSDDGVYKQGMYKVGRDVVAGDYKLKSEGSGYYAILSDTKGCISSVLENSSFSGEKTVSIKSGQYIKILDATMKAK